MTLYSVLKNSLYLISYLPFLCIISCKWGTQKRYFYFLLLITRDHFTLPSFSIVFLGRIIILITLKLNKISSDTCVCIWLKKIIITLSKAFMPHLYIFFLTQLIYKTYRLLKIVVMWNVLLIMVNKLFSEFWSMYSCLKQFQ